MNKSPAFQFYPDKFIAGTRHLSDKAFRVYMDCLCWMWLHSEDHFSIKFDEKVIRKQLSMSKYVYANAWCGEIMDEHHPLLKIEGDRLVSNGLRKERFKQERRSEAGKTGAKARWDSSDRKKIASQSQCLPSPSPSPSSSLSLKERDIICRVVEHMNEKWKTSFRTNAKHTQKIIIARINEGYTEEDLTRAIDNVTNAWRMKPEMHEYWRPLTVFAQTKFEGYVNMKKSGVAKKRGIAEILADESLPF